MPPSDYTIYVNFMPLKTDIRDRRSEIRALKYCLLLNLRSVVLPYKIEKISRNRRPRDRPIKMFQPESVLVGPNNPTQALQDPSASVVDPMTTKEAANDGALLPIPSIERFRTHFWPPERLLSLVQPGLLTDSTPTKITKDMLRDNQFIGQVNLDTEFLQNTVLKGTIPQFDKIL